MDTPITTLSFVPGLNLDDLSFTDLEILQAETLIAESISARQTSLDVSPSSSIYDLVVRPKAVEYLLNRSQSFAIQATQSLKGVQLNPTLANDTVVDAILSNIGVARKTGTFASGNIRINVSKNITYSITANQVFTSQNGSTFKPTGAFVALSDPGETNLKLYATDLAGTQYFFIVPVIAINAGVSSQIPDGSSITASLAIPNFISASTFGSFSGASEKETIDQLLLRIPEALSAKNRVSRVSLSSELKTEFPEVIDVSVMGYGDESLIRGSGKILPVKGGGFADVWVRTSLSAESVFLTTSATLESTSAAGVATCSCTIPATTYPGHFFVASVRLSVESQQYGSYTITGQTKSFVASGHKIINAIEGSLSAYQTTTVTFTVEREVGKLFPTAGVPFQVSVELLGIPLIKEIQDYIDDNNSRAAGVDYLVKASVPCLVYTSPITIYIDSSVKESDIQVAIYSYINNTKMGTPLAVDGIVSAIKSITGVSKVSFPVEINGVVFCPDGSTISLTSYDSLVIPNRSDIQVEQSTVSFYISTDDISINAIVI